MQGLQLGDVQWARTSGIVALVLGLALALEPTPARAQDFFRALSRLFTPVPPPVATYHSPWYPTGPEFHHPVNKVRPNRTHVEQAPIKMPAKAKAPGDIANPVPDLLTDNTLQVGDLVMFPDGLRVFAGEPGSRHVLADFAPVDRAVRVVPADTRKLVAHLRPGTNAAWKVDTLRSNPKVVANSADVGMTGSTRRNSP